MAFIKINPEGMLTVINNLDERADGIATERKKSTTPAETTTIQCLPWTWPLVPPPIPASWTELGIGNSQRLFPGSVQSG